MSSVDIKGARTSEEADEEERDGDFMKGSKRDRWLKDGIKVSRHWYKKMWNRRARHNKNLRDGSFYKRLAKESAWEGIP